MSSTVRDLFQYVSFFMVSLTKLHIIYVFSCSLDRASLYNLVNETNSVHKILCIFRQFYLLPLHVSDVSRSIIRRNNCIYTTLGISSDDGSGDVRNMLRLYKKLTKYTANIVHQVGFIYKIIYILLFLPSAYGLSMTFHS
jgi:hypothetical protein